MGLILSKPDSPSRLGRDKTTVVIKQFAFKYSVDFTSIL